MSKKHIAALFFLILNVALFAQQDSSEVLFRRAQELESSGKRKEARREMDKLVQAHPENLDFTIFYARLKSFDGEYAAAIQDLQHVREKDPDNYDMLFALADVARWDRQYELSAESAASLQRYFPKDKNGPLKIALALEAQEKYEEAEKTLEAALDRFPGDVEILETLQRIRDKNYKQHVGAFYYNTSFVQKFAPWHFGGLEYMRKTRLAPIRVIASVAGRFQTQSLQLEAEAYPRLGKKSYLYASAGFSTGKGLFPDWRSGLEIYHVLPRKWEVSLGFRNLNYVSKLGPDDMNFVWTATLGKYFPKSWAYYRTYARFEVTGSSFSHLLHYRQYLRDEDRYLALSLIQGENPLFVGWLNQLSTLNTTGVALDYQFKWKSKNICKLGFLYEKEEFFPGMMRDRLTFMFTYLKRF